MESVSEAMLPELIFDQSCERTSDSVSVSSYLQQGNLGERILAGLALVPLLPIIGILVVLVRFTSKGPGIFRQRRVGLNGTVYTMYKLRTMRCDAESKTGPIWSTDRDPRTTRFGSFLRKAHLDELPQLFNILKGEMSLVGPRPERPEFVRVLEDEVPGYCQRLRVRPGITGLAQVNLPPDSGTDSVRRKVRLDVEYIRTANFLLDAQIVVCTLLKVLFIPSSYRTRFTGCDRTRCLKDLNYESAALALTPAELLERRNSTHRRPSLERPHKPK
jgi:lipopolysaccharide/colanic/teichoic acid biosynthesis glycosyltransferase